MNQKENLFSSTLSLSPVLAYPSSPMPLIETIKKKNATKKRKEMTTAVETLIPFPKGGKANDINNENFNDYSSIQISMPPPLLKSKNKQNVSLESDPSSAQMNTEKIPFGYENTQKVTHPVDMEINHSKNKDIVKSYPTKNVSLNTSVSVRKKIFELFFIFSEQDTSLVKQYNSYFIFLLYLFLLSILLTLFFLYLHYIIIYIYLHSHKCIYDLLSLYCFPFLNYYFYSLFF